MTLWRKSRASGDAESYGHRRWPDRTSHPASLAVLRELITDPEDCRQRFAPFLSSYWQACISPDWPTLEARLRADRHLLVGLVALDLANTLAARAKARLVPVA